MHKIKIKDDHFTKYHPGKISNNHDLIETDQNCENLYGTGTVKGFESNYIDTYVECQRNAGQDFVTINAELWTFLVERYGGDEIKRQYYKTSSFGYSNVESKLKAISLRVLYSQYLNDGNIEPSMFKQWWTQVSKTTTLKDFKKRALDIINAAGFRIGDEDLRIWLYTNQDKSIEPLKTKCAEVKQGFQDQANQAHEDPDLEVNSGV